MYYKAAYKVSDYSLLSQNLESFARLKADNNEFKESSVLLAKNKFIRENKELIIDDEAESSVDRNEIEMKFNQKIGRI